ncbi:MAG: hypothetical protein JRJ12_15070 [Deltaproteobacteria bacterium]|nr:hypothetical protein [Deltaproteobacteria bacterium]MBW2072779.1 hypothetical protein [Deltaproteobacteria bacterium]
MRKIISVWLFWLAFSLLLLSSADGAALEGIIELFDSTNISMSGQHYELVDGEKASLYGFVTECWVVQGTEIYQIDCKTLADVGYVDRARVTLENGAVRKVEVLKLLQ